MTYACNQHLKAASTVTPPILTYSRTYSTSSLLPTPPFETDKKLGQVYVQKCPPANASAVQRGTA